MQVLCFEVLTAKGNWQSVKGSLVVNNGVKQGGRRLRFSAGGLPGVRSSSGGGRGGSGGVDTTGRSVRSLLEEANPLGGGTGAFSVVLPSRSAPGGTWTGVRCVRSIDVI